LSAGQEEVTDSLLVSRFLQGNKLAFDAVGRRRGSLVRGVLFRLVQDVQDAEDLSQETFLKVFRNLETFRGDSSLKTWILKIATHLALDLRRKRKGRPGRVPLEDAAARQATSCTAGAALSLKEGEQAMQEALARLPFKQRAALVMKAMEGMRYEEIGQVLGTTAQAVKANIHLARKRMMTLMEDVL